MGPLDLPSVKHPSLILAENSRMARKSQSDRVAGASLGWIRQLNETQSADLCLSRSVKLFLSIHLA